MPTKTEEVHRLPLRIPKGAFEQLEAVATRRGLNVSDYIREAIAEQLTRDGVPTSGHELQIGQHGGRRVPSPERTAMPKIIQSYPEELLEGRKTAVLAPASKKDHYATDSNWELVGAGGAYVIPDGTTVQGVRLMGVYEYRVGDTVAVYGVAAASGPAVCYVRIERIELVNWIRLTDEQTRALGTPLTLPETERRGWFMRVSLVEDGLPPEEPSQPSEAVTIQFLS